jgi:hypothetical protein
MLHAHSSKEGKEEEVHKFACQTKTYAQSEKKTSPESIQTEHFQDLTSVLTT